MAPASTPEGNLWVTDGQGRNGKGHQVFKFSPDGRVLMTLGKAGVAGERPRPHSTSPPTSWSRPNGDIFVADGHRDTGNNRIVKFSKDGTFLKTWGHKGSGPGELHEPHTIALDSQGRLFVGDRENNRIQIFDQDGRFLAEWKQFGRPSGIFITKDDTIYVADSESGPDTGANERPGWKKRYPNRQRAHGRSHSLHRRHGIDARRSQRRGRRRRRCSGQTSTEPSSVRKMLEKHIRQ